MGLWLGLRITLRERPAHSRVRVLSAQRKAICSLVMPRLIEILIKPASYKAMVGHHVGPAVFAAFADD